MYRIIATDLDETLLTTEERSVSERDRVSITAAQRRGVHLDPRRGAPSARRRGR